MDRFIDLAVSNAVILQNADVLIVDYFYSAMFCINAIRRAPKTVLLTLNREAQLYWETMKYLVQPQSRGLREVARLVRLWTHQQAVLRMVDKIIALSEADTPRKRGRVITPYLDAKPSRWKPNRSQTIFFVGNIGHYPNRMAIDYILSKLAPSLMEILPSARFKIIGAAPEDVSSHHESVELLGRSDAAEVERQFLNCQLFICPVKNTFGLKFKIAEALSYGTPFLASHESLLCVPYLQDLPAISLENARLAAEEIKRVIVDGADTLKLAEVISEKQNRFVESQKNIWSRSIFD